MRGASADKRHKAYVESPWAGASGRAILVGVLAILVMGVGRVGAEAEPIEVAVRKAISGLNEYGQGVVDETDTTGPSSQGALKAYKVPEIQAVLERIFATAKDPPTRARALSGLRTFCLEPECDEERLRVLVRKAFFDEDQRVAYAAVWLARNVLAPQECRTLFRQRQETADDPKFLREILRDDVPDYAYAAKFLMRELNRAVPDPADATARAKWYGRMAIVLELCVFPVSLAPPGMRDRLLDLIQVEPSLVRRIALHLRGDKEAVVRLRNAFDNSTSDDVRLALTAAIAWLEPDSKERYRLEGLFSAAIQRFRVSGKDWEHVLRLNELVCVLALYARNEAPLVKVCELSKPLAPTNRREVLQNMIRHTIGGPHRTLLALATLDEEDLGRMLGESAEMRAQLRWSLVALSTLSFYIEDLPSDKKARLTKTVEFLARRFYPGVSIQGNQVRVPPDLAR